MAAKKAAASIYEQDRSLKKAKAGDADLGPLRLLPGKWVGNGRGWNMIALPGVDPSGNPGPPFRLLMNQYDEELTFNLVDKGVPNRGISFENGPPPVDHDQLLVVLDYEQKIAQTAAEDFPVSGKAGDPGLPIHHEPGLWIHMLDQRTANLDIARLATIPHGDSVLALGTSDKVEGLAPINPYNGLPIGVPQNINLPYNAPYKHFEDNPFFGDVPPGLPGFPGFHPLDGHAILNFANAEFDEGDVVSTTILEVDSTIESGGISNIPFIVKQANAASMRSTFWIHELAEKDTNGDPKLRMQYSQVVILDFFPRRDQNPGLIRWPHLSINTLTKEV